MSNIKASGFGVRFFRRGIQTRAGKSALQDNAATAARASGSVWRKSFNKAAENYSGDVPLQDFPIADRVFVSILRRRDPAVMKQARLEQALWTAAQNGDCARIRMLVMEGVDLDARDAQGRTALNIATHCNQANAIKTLMAAKEMLRMAKLGLLPENHFFHRSAKTGAQNKK